MAKVHKVRTPLFPTYRQAAALMRAATGVKATAIRAMISAIHEQTGTPQNPVDWAEPAVWIPERLRGSHAELAMAIWQQDGSVLNPRHSYGPYMFINNFDLMAADAAGNWKPTARGAAFLSNDPAVMRELDDCEGMIDLLGLLASRERAKRGDLLPEWTAFLHQVSNFSSDSVCSSSLHQRLINLVDRGLVSRDGNSYQITAEGRKWLGAALPAGKVDPRRDLLEAIQRYNDQQKALLRQQIETMDPYQFERLVGELLEAMGYEDVEVTKQSGDKGVDVVGRVEVGITTITEVVQVKRIPGSIGRPVIDQLRGALPYHKAIRGTLITIGKFAGNCAEAALFPGAAPITLIDGDRLLDLLIEHNVGIRRSHAVELLDVDMSKFDSPDMSA